jgi:excisionase family DNA binding protein
MSSKFFREGKMKDLEFRPKRLVSIKQAAELLGLSDRWLYNKIADGSIPIIKLGGATRIAISDLEQIVEKGRRG